MWIQESFYKYACAIILVLTIILLLYHTAPVFYPLLWFIAAILLPILFATFLYYISRPAVDFLAAWGLPRYLAILGLYLAAFLFFLIIPLLLGPNLVEELSTIGKVSPEKIESLKTSTRSFVESIKLYLPTAQWPTIENILFTYLQKINSYIYMMAINTVSTLASIAIGLALTPFVLFYFLRDASLFSRFLLRFVPQEYKDEALKILQDIDSTLSGFILAQVSVAIVVGMFLFFGYLLIGLPQALSLALFAMFFYVIPVLGTFIAIIPALIVAFTMSFSMVINVILVMMIAHFLEANLLTPRLMSRLLKIHPLTIILLLLAAGSLYGLLGLLLVTPTYALIKVIAWNLYKISRLHYTMAKVKAGTEAPELP